RQDQNAEPDRESCHGSPPMITLVGLGPSTSDQLSVAARDALRAAKVLYLRTSRHPAAEELRRQGVEFHSLDSIYDSEPSFEAVYARIAGTVLAAAAESDVTFAVPGHPLVGEESVRLIIQRARERGIAYKVVGSSSFIEPVLTALNLSLTESLCILDALS